MINNIHLSFATVFTLLLVLSGQAQEITGVVTDPMGIPVPKANIRIDHPLQHTESNAAGKFAFSEITHGKHIITIDHVGHATIQRRIRFDGTALDLGIIILYENNTLPALEVIAQDSTFGRTRMGSVSGTGIYAAKKNEVIVVGDLDANTATNNARQVFGKVAGINIQESDAGGLQLGIAARGLDPNRSANFTLRQNGHDIAADAIGYPDAYYTPPMDAVERIEVIRGAASLQYGPQFGGVINYVLRPAAKSSFALDTRNTIGSYDLFNSYTRISGTSKKLDYQLTYDRRQGNSWRPNSDFDLNTVLASMGYNIGTRTRLQVSYTHSSYLAQQPGGLTDVQFDRDPSVSYRTRNWFRTNWNIVALQLDHRFTALSRIDLRIWGLLGSRDAIGFLGSANRTDDVNIDRDLISDQYRNIGLELRHLKHYRAIGTNAILLSGVRLYTGRTRKAQGYASNGAGSEFIFNRPDSLEGSNYSFPGSNAALFAENIFTFLQGKLRVVPGVRFEYINTRAEGYYRRTVGPILLEPLYQEERRSARSFFLAGLGLSYTITGTTELYANYSRNYRGITFTDMRVVRVNQIIDPELRDEQGSNADLGWRGSIRRHLNFDLSLFMLHYNDRIGQIQQVDDAFNIIRYTTNIGASRNLGAELFAELDILELIRSGRNKDHLVIYSSVGLLQATYTNSAFDAVIGKSVEYAPSVTIRSGITWRKKNTSATFQYAYTAEQFTEATNAVSTATSVNGLIPAYAVLDLAVRQTIGRCDLKAGMNNVLDSIYFTRRAVSYPGPGIIPSERRSVYLTVAYMLQK